jgi:DNA-binding LytR/AlgR family response regulator
MGGLHRHSEDHGVHVVIAEDEPVIAQRLARLTRKILGDDAAVIECAADLRSALKLLAGRDHPVLILDLNLAGEDGFALVREAVAQPCRTIVVSANTDRALEAFELGVVDFVAKPFAEERLAVALQRAREGGGKRNRHLAVSHAGRVELIPLESIAAIHGDDDYSSIETLEGRRYLHSKTLRAMLDVLPSNFRRIHRSHIVNLVHARRIVMERSGSRSVELSSGSRVPISRGEATRLARDIVGAG